jgi:SAM-dependent methyltransferase
MSSPTRSRTFTPPPLVERAAAGLHAAVFERFRALVPPPAHVLDCGAGTGAWAARLFNAGYSSLIAADIDREAFAAHVPFFAADLNAPFARPALELSGRRFDALTAIEVIEHLENPSHFLRQCVQCLAPHGRLFVTTPNPACLPGRLKFLRSGDLRMFDAKGDPTHITPLTIPVFTRLAERNGLVVVEVVPLLPFTCSRAGVRFASRLLSRFLCGATEGDCNLIVCRLEAVGPQ